MTGIESDAPDQRVHEYGWVAGNDYVFSGADGGFLSLDVSPVDIAPACSGMPLLPDMFRVCNGSHILFWHLQRWLFNRETPLEMPSISSRGNRFPAQTYR